MKETAERISLLYGKILDNQDWEIQDLDELLDLSRKDGIEWKFQAIPLDKRKETTTSQLA